MFEVTDFLNSKDIAAHWRKIGFDKRCTPLQSAYIVWHNRTKTLAEKHAAWSEIADTMPDCVVAEGHRKLNMDIPEALAASQHEFLRAFMSLQNGLVERFYKNEEKYVYRYRVLYDGDEDFSRWSMLYESAADCFAEAELDADLVPEIRYIELEKLHIGDICRIDIVTGPDKTVYSVDADGLTEPECSLLRAFEWMWFDFPTPFKKGDIVVSPFSPFGYRLYGDEPFVLTLLCSWGSEEYEANGIKGSFGVYKSADGFLEHHRKCADETDMIAHGYFQNEDGSVYYEHMHHYLDLEYCRGELKGARRILKAFSNFIKGEISEDLFAIAYHVLMQEEHLKRQKLKLSCFTDEGLRLAGLK